MSLNPLNELKRRLNDDNTPLPKRLCLAKNVVHSHHFPSAPKERVVAEWLETLMRNNKISGKEMKEVLGWLGAADEVTSELKGKIIQIVSQYLQTNTLLEDDVQSILSFLENTKISSQLIQQVDDYLSITVTVLQYLKHNESNHHILLSNRLLKNLVKCYRECKKKLEFIVKLLDGENLETIFSYLGTECRDSVIDVCQNVLFTMNKKSFFVSFLQTLIRKDNIDELIAEKGENIQSVLKIMSAFFTFPKGRTEKDQKFLSDFIDVFVSCFKTESQLVFAFYIMVVNSLNMDQSYLNAAMKMPPIIFEDNNEKIKRKLFLDMLEILLKNEVDISVRLTDTFGEKISKIEIKKNFTSFLQTVMMGQLKLEGKLDKYSLQIIEVALKLDPILVEQKMEQILPPVMTAKKNSSIMTPYVKTLNCLLEMLFKLSRGTIFVNQILPQVKLSLEASNTEQFAIMQKIQESTDNGTDCERLKSKVVTGKDVFPQECVEMYGKWTSELMFRQNKELFLLLQKDFEEHCLMMLEEGFVSPSIITLTEVLSAILSSFLRHSKMADHTVPRSVAEDFWTVYRNFEDECLRKFGECVLKLSYNPQLTLSFLQLCLSFAQLKILNIKYSNTKLSVSVEASTSNVFDLSAVLPCLSSEQWTAISGRVLEEDAVLVLNNLLLTKTMALNLLSKPSTDQTDAIFSTKTHLIKQPASNILENHFARVLLVDLDKSQAKQLAKSIVKLYLSDNNTEIKNHAVMNNRTILNALVSETCKNLTKCFDGTEDFTKALGKSDFDMTSFAKNLDMKLYFEQISLKDGQEDILTNCVEILRQLPVHCLDESYQLVAIFVLLVTKKCCHIKKLRKIVDNTLRSVFELSSKYPDLYKIFQVDFIFSFEDDCFIDLLTLKIKTANNLLLIKCVLESAVKKVKTDSCIIKNIVDILLSKQGHKDGDASSIEYFSDPVFQITCIILPLIAKEKKAITTSAYRSILADLQEKLHNSMLESFKNIDFGSNGYFFVDTTGNTEDSVVACESNLATLNAMGAYSLTLSKYCESTDAGELKNLDCLWSGLEFFVNNAIQSIQNPSTKAQHVDSSIQLLNVILRHTKKLDSHPIFQKKDQIFTQIWKSIVARLILMFDRNGKMCMNLEDLSVTLKFICELSSVECFAANFIGDLASLRALKKPSQMSKEESPNQLTSLKTSKYLWTQCLKANIVGPKCAALTKLASKTCKDTRLWIRQHFGQGRERKRKYVEADEKSEKELLKPIKVGDVVCEALRIDLDTLSEIILAGKKITLDHMFLHSIFELEHLVLHLAETSSDSWAAILLQACAGVLNSLLMARAELLEDRWPNYMQCYRALLRRLCELAATSTTPTTPATPATPGDRLADVAHTIEKLTQSICKRKTHVARISAYTVADVCSLLETHAPSKMTRQHLENAVALLIQASDSSYAVAFLRRALAGSPGHTTMTNLYTGYKRYHKYVGNA